MLVMSFVFLEELITKVGLFDKEIRRRIAMGKAAIGGLTPIYIYGKTGGSSLSQK